MRRPSVIVRDARPADVDELAPIWTEARNAAGAASLTLGSGDREALAARVDASLDDPDRRLLVAEYDGRIAGVAYLVYDRVSPLDDDSAVHVAYLHVVQSCRRHGVGSALLDATADFAEFLRASHVIVSVPQSLREANRFYARLGLAPAITHRVTTTAVLRRKLSGAEGNRIAAVLSQRRLARHRALAPALQVADAPIVEP